MTVFQNQSISAGGKSSLTLAAPYATLDLVQFAIFSIAALQLSTKNSIRGTMHDSILTHLSKTLKHHLSEEATLYADLLAIGHRASENPPSTVPVSLVPTAARPHIVIIQGKDVQLLELSYCSYKH